MVLWFAGCRDAAVQERAFCYLHQLQAALLLEFSGQSSMGTTADELLKKPTSWSGNYIFS